jgi:hypothetical protein
VRPDEGKVSNLENISSMAGASGGYGALLVAAARAAERDREPELITPRPIRST